ncbi:type II secretion system F family protein [Ampullimonas aquatilis]|uniref:type II secretion system F family protein n=1 Tax=Ampullimonas aquatilis TaxID=1341549 RepID=UPI003C7685DA
MQFIITAMRQHELHIFAIDATSEDEAIARAKTQGYAVLKAEQKKQLIDLSGLVRKEFPHTQFNQGLLSLIKAGLSLVESIEALAEKEARAESSRVIKKLLGHLYEGLTFSAALEKQPEVFPAIYIATIRANERTGSLVEAIERYIAYRAQVDEVRKKIVSASIYPAVIMGVGGLVILFLLFYVIPKFSTVFEDMGDRIPAMSRYLLNWGKFVETNGSSVFLFLGLVIVGIFVLFGQASVRALIGRQFNKIPSIGDFTKLYQLSRFYRTMGMLLKAGIPVVTALGMIEGLLPESFRNNLQQVKTHIKEGVSMSQAFERNGLTTAVSSRMLRVGEKTGQMGEMMERIAVFYEADVAEKIDWFVRLFEPILMIVIGVIIGVVILLMYAPIFELAGSVQ